MSRGAVIHTYSGGIFYPLDPRPEEIDIRDVAHALSNICRFTGHCSSFYSVAQHSVLCAMESSDENALWCLLHDASEAYLADVPRPLKAADEFGQWYCSFEAGVQFAVSQRFGLPWPMPKEVHEVDDLLLATEQRDLMSGTEPWFPDVVPLVKRIEPWYSTDAERTFLRVFDKLTKLRRAA